MKRLLPEYLLEEKYILNEADEDTKETVTFETAGDWATKLKNDSDLNSTAWQNYLTMTFGDTNRAKKVASLGKAVLEEYKEYGFNPTQNPFIDFIKFLVDNNYNVNYINYSVIHNAVVDELISLKDIKADANAVVGKAHIIYCKSFYEQPNTNLQEYIKWQRLIISKIKNNASLNNKYRSKDEDKLDSKYRSKDKDKLELNKIDFTEIKGNEKKLNLFCLLDYLLERGEMEEKDVETAVKTANLRKIEVLKALVRDLFNLSPETQIGDKKDFETGNFANFVHTKTTDSETALGYIAAILSRKLWKSQIIEDAVNKELQANNITAITFASLNLTGRNELADSLIKDANDKDILSTTNEYLNGINISSDNTILQKEVAILLINIGSGKENWWELPKDSLK